MTRPHLKPALLATALVGMIAAGIAFASPTYPTHPNGPRRAPTPTRAPAQVQGDAEKVETTPDLIAIKFHADWCLQCKAMGTTFDDLERKFEEKPVLFIKLDLTDGGNRRQAGYLMHELDLEKVWDENGPSTGFILLIDPESGEVVSKIDPKDDWKSAQGKLMDALES